MFYWLIEKFLLKGRPAENHVRILEKYLGELPRNIGIAILSSAIVLNLTDVRMGVYKLGFLYFFGLFLIVSSTKWDTEMFTIDDIKWLKKAIKELEEIKTSRKKHK